VRPEANHLSGVEKKTHTLLGMAEFEGGDLAIFDSALVGKLFVEVLNCDERPHYCSVRLIEAPARGSSLGLGSVFEAPKGFLSHYQKPVRNTVSSKKRQKALQEALEEATGIDAGPGSWADFLREYNGSRIPKGAQAAWSNGRKGEWFKNPLSSGERRHWKYSQEGGLQRAGYRATRKNRNMLAKWRRGESIGFTGVASLKAKGLIPRTSRKNRGKKIVGPKYR
jgi:hypothetical protein